MDSDGKLQLAGIARPEDDRNYSFRLPEEIESPVTLVVAATDWAEAMDLRGRFLDLPEVFLLRD